MAWDDNVLRAEVLGEFADATAFSSIDATDFEAKLHAERRAKDAERSRDYYKFKVKADPEALERYRERKRLDMRRRRGMRERMEDLREGMTHHFTIFAKCAKLKCIAGKIGDKTCLRCSGGGVREVDGYITCNTYEDGRLGEIFIRVGKSGAEEAIYEQWAISASMALQFGVPVDAYFKKFLGTRFEPSGATKNKDIARCTSVLDYVARYVLARYVVNVDDAQPQGTDLIVNGAG